MKIVFCTYDEKHAINGINTWLLNLLPLLQHRGHEIDVIYYSWSAESECATIPLLKEKGIACHRITGKSYLEREVKWITEKINILQPDIFVANHILQAWYAARYIKLSGIPTIGVLHNDNAEYQALVNSFLNKNSQSFTACVAVSSKLYEMLLPNTSNLVIKQIACGTPIFTRKASYNKNPFKVFYIGRLTSEQKNIKLVVETLSAITENFAEIEAFIYGSGPELDMVKSTIQKAKFPERIKLMGLVENTKIHEDIINAQAIMLMSDYEGLPVSIMEAMAAGVVPVCKRTESGLSEVIINNYSGFLVENKAEFSEKIKYLLENPEAWQQLSNNAKESVENNFGIEKVAIKWENLFHEIHTDHRRENILSQKINLPKANIDEILIGNREPSLFRKLQSKFKKLLVNVKK